MTRWSGANGITLHYESRGAGDPVILLHGFPETKRSWDLQVPALVRAGYRTVVPDLRGYGKSDKPRTGYDIETLAADVERLIDTLGPGPVRVVGHDWGGAITWQLLDTCPEKLVNATVINCPHPRSLQQALLTNPRQRRRSWYMFFFQLPLLPERWLSKNAGENLALLFRATSPANSRVPAELVQAQVSTLLEPDGLRGPIAYYRSAFRTSAKQLFSRGRREPRARSSAPPATLIWGEEDSCLGTELIPDTERRVPGLEVHLVEHAGHFVHQERPEIVNELLLAALARTEARA